LPTCVFALLCSKEALGHRWADLVPSPAPVPPAGTKLYNVSIEEAINPTSYDPTYKDDLNDKFDYIAPGWKPFKAIRPDDLKPPAHPVPGARKSFVATDEAMLNLCDEPNLIRLHGALNGLHPVPAPQLYPIFSLSKTNLHADIMVRARASLFCCATYR
jgi:hypothetical protein